MLPLSLEILDLRGNEIGGGTPHKFTGGIPAEWSSMANLKQLRMVNCGLEGKFAVGTTRYTTRRSESRSQSRISFEPSSQPNSPNSKSESACDNDLRARRNGARGDAQSDEPRAPLPRRQQLAEAQRVPNRLRR